MIPYVSGATNSSAQFQSVNGVFSHALAFGETENALYMISQNQSNIV